MLDKMKSFWFRATIFLIALGAVVYANVIFTPLFDKFKKFFFLTNSWFDYVLIFIFAYCLFWILEWLLKLTYHILAGHREHK